MKNRNVSYIAEISNTDSARALINFARKHLPHNIRLELRGRGKRKDFQTNANHDLRLADAERFAIYAKFVMPSDIGAGLDYTRRNTMPPETFLPIIKQLT